VFSSPKTIHGRRVVQIGAETTQSLSEHKKLQDIQNQSFDWQENGMTFPSIAGTPTDQRNLHKFFTRLLEKAELPDMRFHDLRHTAATLMLMNGIPLVVISRRLGHSKPSVTLDVYGHYLPGMQEEAASLMDELVVPTEATKWQQIGNSKEENEGLKVDLTPNVAVSREKTAKSRRKSRIFLAHPEGLEPPTY